MYQIESLALRTFLDTKRPQCTGYSCRFKSVWTLHQYSLYDIFKFIQRHFTIRFIIMVIYNLRNFKKNLSFL